MNPDPFENLIKTSQRGSPKVQVKSSEPSEDAFKALIKQAPQEVASNRKYQDLNWFEKNFTSEGQEAQASKNRNFLKSALSGTAAGFSEYFDPLKVDYDEENSNIGYMIGALAPIGLTYKGIGLGFNVLKNLYSFGPKAKLGLELAHQWATGVTYGATKELANVAKGEEFDPYAPVIEGAEFAAFGALLHGLVKYAPKAKEWLSSLRPGQADEFLQGVLPDDLTPNQYKFWQNEVAPEWLESSQKKYKEAVTKANQQADAKFAQDKSIAQANHEKDLFEARQANNLTQEKYEQSVKEYENNLQKAIDEHEAKVAEIEAENEQMTSEFEEAQESYQQMRTREAAVENATRLRPGEENLAYRPAPNNVENPSSTNEVGNLISPNEAVNSTNMGRCNIVAVRANDSADYSVVNDAYRLSDRLSSGITDIRTNLVSQLETSARELREIAHLSAPQRQHLQAIEDILGRLRTVGENGQLTGFLEVDNHFLHEQAKSLRYVMDFTFEHGNTKGIFGRTVAQLEESAEVVARAQGNDAAADANINARRLYRKWAEEYNNDYIRPYRDTRNQDYSGIFKQATNSTDEFNALNDILSKSNAGQQLSSATRRALVENKLGKFLENPHQANGREFELALRELGSVISPQEAGEIRQIFRNARNQPEPVKKPPKPPSLKEIPEPKLPEFKGQRGREKEITTAKIARREFVETPEVKIAAKEMKKTPTQIRNLADSPEGINQLKDNVSPDVFKKIGQQRLREILYKGDINPGNISGNSIAKTLNTGNNFELIAEFIGEAEAFETLEAAQAIGDSPFTKENLLKYGKKVAAIKALVFFGVL
jgi:hypothetical protein